MSHLTGNTLNKQRACLSVLQYLNIYTMGITLFLLLSGMYWAMKQHIRIQCIAHQGSVIELLTAFQAI